MRSSLLAACAALFVSTASLAIGAAPDTASIGSGKTTSNCPYSTADVQGALPGPEFTPRDRSTLLAANSMCQDQCDVALKQCLSAGRPESDCKEERQRCRGSCDL